MFLRFRQEFYTANFIYWLTADTHETYNANKEDLFRAFKPASRSPTAEAQKKSRTSAGLISTEKPESSAIWETASEQFLELRAEKANR